jgi:hypothetical protein
MKSIISFTFKNDCLTLHTNEFKKSIFFFFMKSIVLFQKWVQPLQRRLQSVHEAHRAGLQPREAREIRPNEVKQQSLN